MNINDIEDIIIFQEKLMNISVESVDSLTNTIKDFYFSCEDKNKFRKQISFNVVNSVKFRPILASVYLKLIKNLECTPCKIKKRIIKLIFSGTISSNIEQRVPQVYLLFLLYSDGLLSIEEIGKKIVQMEQNSPYFYLVFGWFCPEIEKINPQFFDSVINDKLHIPNESPQNIKNFYFKIKKYKHNSWSLLKEKRIFCYEKSSISNIIINNQIDLFQSKDLDGSIKRIRTSIFEINWILWNYPSYIEIAAFYGSYDFIKYFLENGFDIYEDFQTFDLLSFAIAGGNNIVIEYLKNNYAVNQEGMNQSEFASTLFHRNTFLTLTTLKEKLSLIFGSLGQIAVSSNNLYVLNKIKLSDKIDYSLNSIENGESESAEFIIHHQVDILNNNDYLYYLVKMEYKTLLSMILPLKLFDIYSLIIQQNKVKLLDFLIDYKFISEENLSIDFVIILLCSKNDDLFIKLINIFPSKIALTSQEGETLLSIAVQNNSINIVNFLLSFNRIDINQADSMGVLYPFLIGHQFILLFQKT